MKNYRAQGGCWSCKHVFTDISRNVFAEYCTKGGSGRPQGTEQELTLRNSETESQRIENNRLKIAWHDWRQSRRVANYGICDDFESADWAEDNKPIDK